MGKPAVVYTDGTECLMAEEVSTTPDDRRVYANVEMSQILTRGMEAARKYSEETPANHGRMSEAIEFLEFELERWWETWLPKVIIGLQGLEREHASSVALVIRKLTVWLDRRRSISNSAGATQALLLSRLAFSGVDVAPACSQHRGDGPDDEAVRLGKVPDRRARTSEHIPGRLCRTESSRMYDQISTLEVCLILSLLPRRFDGSSIRLPAPRRRCPPKVTAAALQAQPDLAPCRGKTN